MTVGGICGNPTGMWVCAGIPNIPHTCEYIRDFLYRVTTINMSRKWIEWAGWAALSCTANSPFPGHIYCRHPVCPCLGKDPPIRVRIDKISLGMIAHSWKLMTILLSAQAYRSFLDLVFSRDQPPYSVRKSYTHVPFSSIVTIFCRHRTLHSDFRRRNTTCVFVRNVYAAFNVRGRR